MDFEGLTDWDRNAMKDIRLGAKELGANPRRTQVENTTEN
jgi:hypothetical protein